MPRLALLLILLLLRPGPASAEGTADPRAAELAAHTLQAMGGSDAWEGTRYVQWRFFGKRLHIWDKWTGRARIESDETVILMNVNTKEGRVFEAGTEVVDPEAKAKALESGYGMWVNDSYWVFMPYKLRDPGVHLAYVGTGTSEDGRSAEIVSLTFEQVGLTPQNRYEVWIDDDTGLVSQWSFYRNADDEEPAFVSPWNDWREVGRIRLCHDHGRGLDWELAVYDELPDTVFQDPGPPELE